MPDPSSWERTARKRWGIILRDRTTPCLPADGAIQQPLSVDDFTKKMQYSYYTEDALAKIADKVARFAAEEGLDAHGRSVLVRKNRKER